MTSKTPSIRNLRNPVGCLILLAALAAAAGCSTAETTGGSATNMNHVLPSGSSVPGWLVTPSGGSHASTATLDYIANNGSSGCAQCHGSDLTGGISKISCFSNTAAGCHHVTGQGAPTWDDPAAHGAAAKKAPGSSGFASCQICHGKDFSVPLGKDQLNCGECHGSSAPHPKPWRRGSGATTYLHSTTDPANAPVCAQCHRNNNLNPMPSLNPTPAPAGTAPGCYNNTLCHGAAGHPAGWVAAPPSANQPHGNAAKAANGFPGCQTCHGADFNGTASSGNVSCFQGTWNGFNCHNGGSVADWPHAPPPWAASAGSVHTHTTTDNTGTPGNPSVCVNCHNKDTGTPGCFNNTLCHAGVAPHPVPPARYNDSTHYTVTSATFDTACGACHFETGSARKLGPTCTVCHQAASPLAAQNCTSCHGGVATKGPNGPTATASYPNKAGAHAKHWDLGALGNAISCDTCHSGLGSLTDAHYDRANARTGTLRVEPGDVAFVAPFPYTTGTATFNSALAALTCGSISCHGAQTTPGWRATTGTTCTNCHAYGSGQYNSYSSGQHDKHVNGEGYNCTECHNTTTLKVNHFTTLSTKVMEGSASATIGGSGTSVGSYSGGTCTTNCHEDRNWL